MTSAVPNLQTAEAFGLDPFREDVARNMRDLFRPPDDLPRSGGDQRLAPDPLSRRNGLVGPEQCRWLYRALGRDMGEMIGGSAADREIGARHCLFGQPVEFTMRGERPLAVLRLSIGARLITEAWSPDSGTAARNIVRTVERLADVVAKIELLVAHTDRTGFAELSHGA